VHSNTFIIKCIKGHTVGIFG